MSLNYKKENIFGGPVDKEVLELIRQTQTLFGQQSNFSDKQLQFFNSNTGWIKVTSSVNIRAEGFEDVESINLPYLPNPIGGVGFKNLEIPNGGSPDLAKKYVLLGGTLQEQSIRTGILSDTDDSRSSYELDPTFGYVPMPGIDNFSVKHAGTYGSLRVASLEFKVNSIQQLSDMEALFMRPGYSLLVEWGHSIYLDASGEIQTQVQTLGDEYFNLYNKKDIVDRVKFLRELSNNNYEAMYAIVTNFTWQYAQNGEYQCKVDLTAAGSIMESLKLAVQGNPQPEKETENEFKRYATPLSEYLYAIQNLTPDLAGKTSKDHVDKLLSGRKEINNVYASVEVVSDKLKQKNKDIFSPIQTELENNGRELKIFSVKTDIDTTQNIASAGSFKYIPLSNLLACLNVNYTLKSNDGVIVDFNIDAEQRQTFTTFLQHIIIDPAVGFIPKNSGNTEIGEGKTYSDSEYFLKYAAVGNELDDHSDILNICVNVDLVINIMEQYLDSTDDTSKTILNLLNNILGQLNIYGGNINEFDLFHNDEGFQFFIIDRKITPGLIDLNDSIIDVFGLNSIIEDLSISSGITSEMSSMIAVAAASERSDLNEQLDNMQKWNKGLIDRTQPAKFLQEVPKEEDKIPAKKILKKLAGLRAGTTISYIESDYKSLQSSHTALMREFLLLYTSKEKTNLPGIIPIELNLQMKGIAGFKIGQGFNITQDLLPERYRDNVAFIITDVEHSITDNKWVSNLTGLMTVASVYGDSRIQTLESLNELNFESTILEKTDAIFQEGIIPIPAVKDIRFPLLGYLPQIRNDEAGQGTFKASRNNESGLHEGVDFLAPAGTRVVSPFPGTVVAGANFSRGLPRVEVVGTGDYQGYRMMLGYVESNGITSTNAAGTVIGSVVRLDGKEKRSIRGIKEEVDIPGKGYKDVNMKNHIHVELRYNGELINPTDKFTATKGPFFESLTKKLLG